MNDQDFSVFTSFQSPHPNALCINKLLVKKHGFNLAIFYAFIIEEKYDIVSNPGQDPRTIEEDGSFVITQQYITDCIGLSKFQIRDCKKKLKELGMLETYMKGIPAKEFYLIKRQRGILR